MNFFFFFFQFVFQRSNFNQKNTKTFVKEKILVHPIQLTRSTYCGIIFQTMYVSKI